jgi:hypothetical protein
MLFEWLCSRIEAMESKDSPAQARTTSELSVTAGERVSVIEGGGESAFALVSCRGTRGLVPAR